MSRRIFFTLFGVIRSFLISILMGYNSTLWYNTPIIIFKEEMEVGLQVFWKLLVWSPVIVEQEEERRSFAHIPMRLMFGKRKHYVKLQWLRYT